MVEVVSMFDEGTSLDQFKGLPTISKTYQTGVINIMKFIFLLDPRPTEGPLKSPLSVCPSVSVAFFSRMGH